MIRSMFSGVTGLRAHQTLMDVIGNNIANVNTNSFKSSRVTFTDVYYQMISSASAASTDAEGTGGSNPSQIGYGTKVASIDVVNTQGGYSQTDKTTDLYISGEGYFLVGNSAGSASYTRVGSFKFDESGFLVDGNGNHVLGASILYTTDTNGNLVNANPTETDSCTLLPESATTGPYVTTADGPIAAANLRRIQVNNLDAYSDVSIAKNGTITGVSDATGEIETLGQIALAEFNNPDGLTQDGSMYFSVSQNSGEAVISVPGEDGAGKLISGGLEMSNVDLSKQFTDMIVAQRGFQANSRVITTSDEILEELVNLKR